MTHFAEIVLTTLALAVALPITVVFVECLAALWPRRRSPAARRPRIDVLIPAHNEEEGIAATLADVQSQLREGDRLLVVADNCNDRTGRAARACGAWVVERRNQVERGKGYALDFGLRQLEAGHGEVVVIIDADCTLSPGALDALACECGATGLPVQAAYIMTCPPNPTPRDVVSRFAVAVKNQVRQRGSTALGGAALLTGSGMAFPWQTLRSAKLASGNIVEDMQLSFDLLVAGHTPRFCAAAEVYAPLPAARHASLSQRTRWEHGHLQTLLARVPRLLWQGMRQCRPRLWLAALDLAVPPLALLCAAWFVVLAATAAAASFGLSRTPLVVTAASGFALAAAMTLVNLVFCRDISLLRLLIAVPQYIVGKLPIYFAFLIRRQTVWVRTDRADTELRVWHRRAAVATPAADTSAGVASN